MRFAIVFGLLALGCDTAHADLPPAPAVPSAAPLAAALTSAPRAVSRPATPKPRGPCPPEMALVEKSCVDRWEAHLVVAETGAAHPHSDRPEKGVRYRAASASGTFPQAYVNRHEAKAACEASGKRLCSLGEWYRACRGSKRQLYGYGSRYEKGRCNAGKQHLLGKLFGNDPRRWTFDEHFNSPKLSLEPGFLATSGEHAGCTNDHGVFDMIGNLHEWVSDSVDRSLVEKIPLREDIRDKIGINLGHGIFMGGFYSTVAEHGSGCEFLTPGHGPKYHDYSTGFRCCKDARAEP